MPTTRASKRPAPTDPLLTAADVAARLGVHTNTVYTLMAGGALPVVHLGSRTRRVASSALENWIQAGGSTDLAAAEASK
jgi:excisionase family DNA binding protein